MYMGFANANVSGKNNRKLQRTGNSAYKSRKREFLGRNIARTEKPLHDQYNYADRTPPRWKRALVLLTVLAIVVVLGYVLLH